VSNNEPTTGWVASTLDKVSSVGPWGVGALLITLGIAAFASGATPLTIVTVAGLLAIAAVSIVVILGRSKANQVAGRPSDSPVDLDESTPGSVIAEGGSQPSPRLGSRTGAQEQCPLDPAETSDRREGEGLGGS
jgi:hypothetical protein